MDENLANIVKAYDVRGRSPEQLDAKVAYAIGRAFAEETQAGAAVVGRDMRETSEDIANGFADGVIAAGGTVVDIGLASTDLLYFASGEWAMPGVMVTASHNPAGYNGLKMCRSGAKPIGSDTGLQRIAERGSELLGAERQHNTDPDKHTTRDALPDYAQRLHQLVPLDSTRKLKVVVDAGNGMAGHTVPTVFDGLNVELVPLYFELDGSFPNHDANPLDSSTLRDLQAAVVDNEADIGLAFDGDADRCFVVDERGDVVTPSAITALIATRYLRENFGATILHNAICSRAVREIILENGGVPIRTPVGHSLIKAEMAATGALFGGEHSGHFYFSEFFLADSGMLAALHVLAALTESGDTVSALMADSNRYDASGEINTEVGDPAVAINIVEQAFADDSSATIDHLDGLTVNSDDWWFNLRASNTEPLLRLNVEGVDNRTMSAVRDNVRQLIAQENHAS